MKIVCELFGLLNKKPLSLQPLRERNTALKRTEKKVLEKFLKKVSEKFGGSKKMLYLCTTSAKNMAVRPEDDRKI